MGACIAGVIDGLGLMRVDIKAEPNLSGKRSDIIIHDTSGGLVIIIELQLIRRSQMEWDLSRPETHGHVRSFLADTDSPPCSDADVFALSYKEAQFRKSQSKAPAGGSGHSESPLPTNLVKPNKPRSRPHEAPVDKMEPAGRSGANPYKSGGTRRGRSPKTPAHQGIKRIQSKQNEASAQGRMYTNLVRDQLSRNKLVENPAPRRAGPERGGESHPEILCFVAHAVHNSVLVQAVS